MAVLKIGLIGFGSWVRSAYLPALQHDGRAKVTAVTASTDKTRQLARQILGEDIYVYPNYDALLDQADVDAVMVAVPDHVHQEALSAALKAGKAVFYEPPLSHIRQQIPRMIDSLLGAKQVTFAHLELGFHPAIVRAKQLIKENAVGLLQSVSITLHAGWGVKENSDLCLLDRMSCWYVEVLNRITGSIPSRVLLLDGHGGSGRMQSTSMGIYDYDGVWGVFKADVGRPGDLSIVVEAIGDQGELSIDYFTGELRLRQAGKEKLVVEHPTPLQPYADYPCVREAVSAFLDAIASGDAGKGNARQVAQLNLIGLAIDRSKDTGSWAEVKTL